MRDQKNKCKMEITGNKMTYFLFLAGVLLCLFSCTMKPEGKVTDTAVPSDNTLKLSDAQIHLANINTAGIREASLGRQLSLTGILKVNEQGAITISSRLRGRIEKLYFRNTGEKVNKGDILYDFYSEDLVSAQREYYRLQSNNYNFTGKYEPSLILEDKLMLMGMIPSQITQLGKDGKILFTIPIHSPAGGTIRSVNVSDGQFVTEGQPLYELADDRDLWLEAQVYPDEIRFLRTGMPATAIVPVSGEKPVPCTISFINPSYEQGKNVTLVRAVIDNRNNNLYPGMLAILNVQPQAGYGLIVPASAVISGAREDYIWVRNESGEFSRKPVLTGLQSGDSILVLSGLNATETIVTTGAYLLNSELTLKQGESPSDVPELSGMKSEEGDMDRDHH